MGTFCYCVIETYRPTIFVCLICQFLGDTKSSINLPNFILCIFSPFSKYI